MAPTKRQKTPRLRRVDCRREPTDHISTFTETGVLIVVGQSTNSIILIMSSLYETYMETLDSVGESILSWADPEDKFVGYTQVSALLSTADMDRICSWETMSRRRLTYFLLFYSDCLDMSNHDDDGNDNNNNNNNRHRLPAFYYMVTTKTGMALDAFPHCLQHCLDLLFVCCYWFSSDEILAGHGSLSHQVPLQCFPNHVVRLHDLGSWILGLS